MEAALLERHQRRVGVGGAGLEVRATLVPSSPDRPIGSAISGQPAVTLLVGAGEVLTFWLRDRDGKLGSPSLLILVAKSVTAFGCRHGVCGLE
jgi:hypothetical protein